MYISVCELHGYMQFSVSPAEKEHQFMQIVHREQRPKLNKSLFNLSNTYTCELHKKALVTADRMCKMSLHMSEK